MQSPGWYRIAQLGITVDTVSNYDRNTVAQGVAPYSCDIIMRRAYSYTNNEYHHVRLLSVFQMSQLKSIEKLVNTQIITKIRHVVDLNSHLTYLDIYYTANAINNIYFELANNRSGYTWKLLSPQIVESSPTSSQVYFELTL